MPAKQLPTRSADPTARADARPLRERALDALGAHTRAAADPASLSHRDLAQMVHELQVHQVELEMQNEDLRCTQLALDTTRACFADLYDNAPVGYITLSENNKIIQANQMAARLLGRVTGDLVSWPLSRFILRDDQDAYYLLRRRLQSNQQAFSAELRVVRADGSPLWVQLVGNMALDDSGVAVQRVVISDIDQRITDQKNLSLAASVFSQAREGIMITDTNGIIMDVNAAFTHITGYSRDEALGKNPRLLRSGRQTEAFYMALWHDLRDKGHWYGEIWNRRKNGEVYAEMQTITTVHNALGLPTHYVSLFSDITVYKAHQSQLEHLAHYDLLTGLPNRALLSDRLHQSIAQAQRRGSLLGVAYIDLDGFKSVNEIGRAHV